MRLRLSLLVVLLVALLHNHIALAQVAAPSQGGEVGLVLVTATTMELTFGTTGNGQGRVVAIAALSDGRPVPLGATDNTVYTANPSYGKGSTLESGYVIYSGSQHSVTVNGLTPNTYYYIASSEYNTDGTSIAYNTRGTSMSTSTRSGPANVTPLPIELISFTGTLDSRAIATLRWSTATESNTAYFSIERSTDGIGFAEVSRVAAAGNSTQQLTYSSIDPQPLIKVTYYRLKQVDRDGTPHYSTAIALTPLSDLTRQVAVYPNPGTHSSMNLLVQGYEKEVLTLRITDTLGQLIVTQTFQPAVAAYSAILPLPSNLAAGTYIFTLAGTGLPIQKRLIITE